jgi:hypothetical protein
LHLHHAQRFAFENLGLETVSEPRATLDRVFLLETSRRHPDSMALLHGFLGAVMAAMLEAVLTRTTTLLPPIRLIARA